MAGNFETRSGQIELNTIAELYNFSHADGEEYFTTWPDSIDFDGDTYAPAPIKRGDFSVDSNIKSMTVSITAPVTDAFSAYVANAPILPTIVTIYRVYTDDTADFVKIFSGRVQRITIKDKTATAECVSANEVFFRRAPRIVHQAYCNHSLFDPGCGITSGPYETFVVATVSGNTIVHSSFATKPDGYFTGGNAIIGNDERLIVWHAGDTLTLQVAFPGSVGATPAVKAIAGCDKSPQTCTDKFSNFDNFLGFPYIPSKNPILYGFR